MQNAQRYARSNALQRQHATESLRKALLRMRWTCEEAAGAKAAALDVGCGTGDFTADTLKTQLPPCVKALVGMDINEEMVDYASAHFQNQRLRFVQTDIAAPDLRSTPLGAEAEAVGGFCKVFSFFCLHWVQDQRRAFGNIHTLLRKGAEGFFCFVGQTPIFTSYETLMHQPRWNRYMTDAKTFISPYHHTADGVGALSSILTEANFKVLDCREHSFKSIFTTTEEVRAFFEAVNPFMHRIPTEEQSDFITEILHETQKATVLKENVPEEEVDNKTIFYKLLEVHIEK